jgi:acyl transferase domain-containing protein/NAD(P)H-dependent flavin oxidoreductase YrpB (nitropropane dioxygenase family)/NAD(P)-dependent dehydrogenase (short-subunit alcohol dehydrogenase family)
MTPLRCITFLPLALDPPEAASACLRAGALPLLDATGPLEDPVSVLEGALRRLPAGADVGLYLTPERVDLVQTLMGRPHHLVLAGWRAEGIAENLARLAAARRSIWLEMRRSEDLEAAGGLPFQGWLARGSECGGRTGRESAFILCQHLARQDKPFWLQGGIGPHSAAAARVGGASGVVLDDALLLLRDFPLPVAWRAILAKLHPEDSLSLGDAWADGRRIVLSSELPGSRRLQERAQWIRDQVPAPEQAQAWSEAADSGIGWGNPKHLAWPLGQGAGRAREVAARHGTLGRLIRAVTEVSGQSVTSAARLQPLAPHSPLAKAQGTALPVVQGPMTRVSDGVPFAEAVAQAGGLPLLALAMMPRERIEALLREATQCLAETAWGVGLLGYLGGELEQAQFAVVEAARPPFALIAGGRPDQAARLEAAGIATYIHVPTPALLGLYWEQGARRFVFEGAECGGHVGPLNSFALWEAMTEALLDRLTGTGNPVDVLLAGGIHDARSAAMAAALAAPLLERGVRLGILMGSAYLFIREAVQQGAILNAFQRQAMACRHTELIETRPGHRIRCAPSPFVQEFAAQKQALTAQGLAARTLGEALEELLTGKLRLAAKGLERTSQGLVAADEDRQRQQGLFMMGELVGLQDRPQSCAQLHRAVTEEAGALLCACAGGSPVEKEEPPSEPVAIIGIGCLLPGAHDPETLWRHLLDGARVIREIPRERWDWRLYFDEDPEARDRLYAKWGGFIDAVPFDPLAFGIPPKSLPSICMAQLLALETTRRALEDAGLGNLSQYPVLRERTAAIFGVSSTGDLELAYKTRTGVPLASRVEEEFWRRLPQWTEETHPGVLLNIVAGRVANRFDLGGVSFTVDAACASSLAALDLAVRELQSGRSDLALAGAVETEMTPHAYMAFSKTRALSPRGEARVFDEEADGIVLGEGAVTLVLKRLSDAERDGDRVYALIRGLAGSSDGRGMGITAPRPAGQIRAVERAQRAAGLSLASLGLYEAHGTGTNVGDQAEMETFTTALRRAGATAGACATGSVKSLLGHTRCAAGLTGVVKATLALHHRVLPPHWGVSKPLAAFTEPESPLYLLDKPQPWPASAGVRRAGVSAFGFGGANFHAILEAHDSPAPWGADRWPVELFALAAADVAGLSRVLKRLLQAVDALERGWSLRDLALATVLEAARGGPVRLALVAGNAAELRHILELAQQALAQGAESPRGVYWCLEPWEGDLAFVFPGQGAQYPGMGSDLALYSGELREAMDVPDLRRLIWPPAAFDDQEILAQEEALADTRVAQPAIAAVSAGMLDLARRLGLQPARVAGHSFGEFVALHAAGVLSRTELYRLAGARGEVMADLGASDGAMAAVSIDPDVLQPYLAEAPSVHVANINSPRQLVLSGPGAALDALLERLAADGHANRRLSVSVAFHSPLVAAARKPFAAFLRQAVQFRPGILPVHANLDGKPYPQAPREIAERCIAHMEQQVNFVAQVEAMWQAGVRCFLELGPGQSLSRLIRQILRGRSHVVVAADGGLAAWLRAAAQLWVLGQPMELSALFEGRNLDCMTLDALPAAPQSGWMLDGGRVYAQGQPPLMGELPLLNADSPSATVFNGDADPLTIAFGEYQHTMRKFLEQQERMLRQLWEQRPAADGNATLLPPREQESPPQVEAAAPPAAATTPAPGPDADWETLMGQLVQLVSERTGYPTEMLGLDQDMEGELGIDSIKRIEIIGKLVNSLSPETATKLQKAFNQLVRAKTLRALVDRVLQEATSAVMAPAIQLAANALEACPRFVMHPEEKPLPPVVEGTVQGLYLVTADQGDLGALVVEELRRHGTCASLLPLDYLDSTSHLAHRIAVLREVHGPVRAVVHLGAMGLAARQEDLADWRRATNYASKSLFALLQNCLEELQDEAEPLRVVAVTQLGGDWGRGKRLLGSAAAGGCHGILRSLEHEYPHLLAKVVDFDDRLSHPLMVQHIVREAMSPGGGEEVGYQGERRFLFVPALAPHERRPPAQAWTPGGGAVILATGGARGITAEILRELAGPDVRLILVGRSDGASAATEEREANIAAFRRAGALVEYHALDVRSESTFGALIEDLYQRFGHIHGVLHGAGVIEDQRFAAKDPDSFQRVFDTKADSTFILSRKLRPEGLKWVVLFASVAGRFGNHGQADYAAGNETLVRLGHQMDALWSDTRVVAIAWGPWQGAGMASQGVQAQLEAQGIVPIRLEEGRRFLVDELSWGATGQTEVIAGHGPWEQSVDQTLAAVFDASMRLLRLGGARAKNERAT